MAKKGEIDPWNIDVVELADKFLERIEKDLDLRFSARVLLYAAILVRMKAEILVEEAIFEEEEEEETEEDFGFGYADLDIDFDEVLAGSSEENLEFIGKPKRVRRFTTLQELIKELRKAEQLEIKKRRRKKITTGKEEIAKKALEVPHEEDIEETIVKVNAELDRLFKKKDELSFFEIVRGFDLGKIISYYVSILHLAYRKKVELIQERLYEDIKIKRVSL
jgi:segregation and condensation protein A